VQLELEHHQRGRVIVFIVSGREYAAIKQLPWTTDLPSAIARMRSIFSADDFDDFVQAMKIDHVDVEWRAEV